MDRSADPRPARLIAATVAVAALLLATIAPASTSAALATGQLAVVPVVSGLSAPLGVVNAGDGSGRLFVVEQGGTVRVVKGGKLQTGDFLDLSAKVEDSGERGLLGLAFDPDFESNRRLYVYYTRSGGDIVVSRLTANTASTAAPSSSEEVLFTIEHSANTNHNGGAMAFGPDGYLYLGVGDGGGGGDPDQNGQNVDTRLGKLLRIDVDATDAPGGQYGYPPSNPYVGTDGDDAVFAIGLRNPWRISFDRDTGDLWIADVGQGDYEEIDRDVSPPTGGRNYGWSVMEGKHCYGASTCDTTDLVQPIAEYTHAGGNCSVTGGYVYRGPTQHDLQGLYVFGDFCSGRIWTMSAAGTTITERRDTNLLITSFGESESGELYVLGRSGTLYRVVAPEFTDITTSTFIDDIHWLFYAGITTGCSPTTYCPTDPVSRGQMASFLVRALDLPNTSTDYFSDDDGTTHENDINRLRAAGITAGCAPGLFCPGDPVSRGQMASFLSRALDLPDSDTDHFTDDDGTTHERDIDRVAAAGITTGCTATTYCPTADVTRGQMAAFLHRALED